MLSDRILLQEKYCLISLPEKSKVVNSKAENRTAVSRGWGRRTGDLTLTGYKVSVVPGREVLESAGQHWVRH